MKTAPQKNTESGVHRRLREQFPPATGPLFPSTSPADTLPHVHAVDLDRPGHFIFAEECDFSLHTHIGCFCVATIGERHTEISGEKFERVGSDFYTSVVFRLNQYGSPMMPELETCDYATREAAQTGHDELVKKYLANAQENRKSRP